MSSFSALLLAAALGTPAVFAAEGFVWEFSEVHSFAQPDESDPRYLVMLSMKGSRWKSGHSWRLSQLKVYMHHFKVDDPLQLQGRTFENSQDDSSRAMEWLRLDILHGGRYVPPKPEETYQHAVRSLAAGKEPDFSGADSRSVADAFSTAFGPKGLDKEWLAKFQKALSKASGGKTAIRAATKEELEELFPLRVQGVAEYMILERGGKKQPVIFGPYAQPFMVLQL